MEGLRQALASGMTASHLLVPSLSPLSQCIVNVMVNNKQIAWVTGASSGIGKALCERLIIDGWIVIGSARSKANLDKLKSSLGINFHVMPLDIESSSNVMAVMKQSELEIGPIDLAILNAGFYHPETNGLDNIVSKKTIAINVVGTINCLTAILPRFEKRGNGHIALMSSSAGYRGLPRAYSYTSSRAAIINLAESLRIDLRSKGIKVQLITPGFVDTGLTQKNNFHMPFMVSTEVAARRIIKGLSKSNFEITFPRRLTYILKFLRIMPYPIYYALIRLLIK